MFRILASLAVVGCLVAPAAAQMPDFTNMDINALNDGWNYDRNVQMDAATQAMVYQNMNDPVAQQVIASGACGNGTPEQLAYMYGATGGCTRQGFGDFNADTENMINRENQFSESLYPN